MRDIKTKRQLEIQNKLSILNNSLRWFCVEKDFECKIMILPRDWYEKVSTGISKKGNWIHTVKSRTTKEFYRLSDVDHKNIIIKFKDKNKHL